ncbi:MAG: type II secretion system F family protein [Candidatus Altiarchaeota archaeon]
MFGTLSALSTLLSDAAIAAVKLVLWAVNYVLIIIIQLFKTFQSIIKRVMKFIPKIVANFMPNKTSNNMNQQLIYAGVEMTAEEVVGITVVYSIVVTTIAYLTSITLNVTPATTMVAVVTAFGLVWVLPFIIIGILITNRTDTVEETLPDVMSMVAQNMKAGMTSYNALWSAARPEFGTLAIEIQDVAKATLTGVPLTDALIGMTNHVRSNKLQRSVHLIVQGMKSGGDLPAVLHAITTDMRREYNLRKQMAAETSAHSIFILFAIMIGAPLLFSVSFQFVSIFSNMMLKLNVAELAKNAPQSVISISPLAITQDFFLYYAIAILAISGFFGALLVGTLKSGNPVDGIASIPGFVIIPIVIFFVMKFLLGMLFSSMITF